MSTIIYLNRPADEEELTLTLQRRHNCQNAKLLRAATEDPDADLLYFPVGPAGRGLPGDVPFMVTAVDRCKVCGAQPSMWCAWVKRLISTA